MMTAVPKIAACTINLGRAAAGHGLEKKFGAAARAGFQGIEMSIECLQHHAQTYHATAYASSRREALLSASTEARELAEAQGLEIISLLPFVGYDALKGGPALDARFQEALLWIDCCVLLGASMLQVPACLFPLTLDDLTASPSEIAANVARLADAAAPHSIVVAYESPSFALVTPRWQQIHQIIHLAQRENVKHCLDTFHIAGLEAGDPDNATNGFLLVDGRDRLEKSLSELKATLKPEHIVCFQLSDAKAVDLTQSSYPTQIPGSPPSQLVWSRNCRVHPCEPHHGGLLPCVEVAQAVFATGYRGWCSMEVFDPDHYDTRESVSDDWAQRGMASWKELIRICQLG